MTPNRAVYLRVLRRETHAPRTVPAAIVAAIFGLLLLSALALFVWTAFVPQFGETLANLAKDAATREEFVAAGTGVGILLLLAAIFLVIAAVTPGRRHRHTRLTERVGVIADDALLADTVADLVAVRCQLDRSQVSVAIGRRSASVRVTPTSGIPVNEQRARDAALEALSEAGFEVSVKIAVAKRGVVA